MKNIDLRIMPNPVVDRLQYTLHDDQQRQFTIRISDMTGKELHIEPNVTSDGSIDLSQLSSGVYMLEVIHADGILTERFILQ